MADNKKIVLCGGPFDGKVVDPVGATWSGSIAYETVGDELGFYVPTRYASGYPIEGWDFFVDYDATKDELGYEHEAYVPWWTRRVWATVERHREIYTLTSLTLNQCIDEVHHQRWAEVVYPSLDWSQEREFRQAHLDSAIDRIRELTHSDAAL